jgi:hypothetical protein
VPQIDTARTLARTSLGPGTGTGTSRISSTDGSRTTRACMVAGRADIGADSLDFGRGVG